MTSLYDTQRLRNFLEKHRNKLLILIPIVAFGLGFLVHWSLSDVPPPQEVPPDHDHPTETVEPADLGLRQLSVSPQARALMDIDTTRVERRFVTATVRLVGRVDYDETRRKNITAWVPGRLDRLFVDSTGLEVQQGDHLVQIYSPTLYAAQEELIRAVEYDRARGVDRQRPTDARRREIDLVHSSRERLRLLGLTAEQIREIEQMEKPSEHLTIYAPIAGTVIEKLLQEGDYVETGQRIYTIADLSQVWVVLNAYESDLPWLRYGQEVTFTSETYPGEQFIGRISFIEPVLHDETRTVRVRVNVPNPEGKLKPAMFIRGVVRTQVAAASKVFDPYLADKWICRMHPEVVREQPGRCDICDMELVPTATLGYIVPDAEEVPPPLVIPVSAALVTGTRAIVYVEVPDAAEPTFEGREIVLGPRAGDHYIVRKGLEEGELVVSRGNFKIDSELQLQAKPSMMSPEGAPAPVHDHGAPDDADHDPAAHEAVGMAEIPADFLEQLQQLETSYQEVSSAMATQQLARITDAYSALEHALYQMDGTLLAGEPRSQWNEFAMLLNNDVFEGREAETFQESQRVYQLLTRHMRRLGERFMPLPEEPREPAEHLQHAGH